MILQNPDNPGRKLPPLLDYSELREDKRKTRNSESGHDCDCGLCDIARMKNEEKKKFAQKHTNPVGAPPSNPPEFPPSPIKVCPRCFSEVGPGKPHHCVKTVRRENLATLVRSSSEKSKSAVTVSVLSSMADDQGVSKRGGTINLSSGSKKLPIKIGTDKTKVPQKKFSHEDLMALKTDLNLSDNSTL